MTRAHARLLGPCFKTGPESTQSYSVADGRVRSLFEITAASSRTGPESAPGPTSKLPSALAAGRTRYRGPAPSVYRRASRPGHRGSERRRTSARTPQRALDRHPTGRDVLQGDKCTRSEADGRNRRGSPEGSPSHDRDSPPAETRLNVPLRPFGFLRFTPERFHVLLNSLFKVLFNFPSRYLFAIGLVVIFSLRWSLPPT